MKMNRLFSFPQHDSGRDTLRSRKRTCSLICLVCGALLFSILLWAEDSEAEDKEQGSLAEVGAKLSNPVSDVWALFTEFDLFFSDGDVNRGDSKIGTPVGVTVSKMTKIGDVPVKFQLGIEYSVVKQDDFGQVAQIRLNIIPVISSLIKNPLFGK